MDKNNIKNILNCISPELRGYLEKMPESVWANAEEIRLSILKPVMVCFKKGFSYVDTPQGVYICSRKTIEETLLLMSENSMYAVSEKLLKGFLTIKGGNRAGVVGTAVMEHGRISAIKDISAINIRIRREVKGLASSVMREIVTNSVINNTLIISPPGCGKTTMLRDICRILGNGAEGFDPFKTVIVDERSEIAAVCDGCAQNDIGLRTVVFDNCPKSTGIPYVIRSMTPEVIITDELDAQTDIEAVNYAISSGVKIISSAHGENVKTLINKKGFKNIITAFDVFITLDKNQKRGVVESVRRWSDIDL